MIYEEIVSIRLKDPTKKPKTYHEDLADIEPTVTAYDFSALAKNSQKTNMVYSKVPRELYNKLLKMVREKRPSRSSWSAEEDKRLVSLVKLYGTKQWPLVASELGTSKPAKACRDRYLNHANPEIKRGDWTHEEDTLLMQLHETHGNHWTKIAKFIQGRTANNVKNRWHGYLKKRPKEEFLRPNPSPISTSTTQQLHPHPLSISVSAATPDADGEESEQASKSAHHASASDSAPREAQPFSSDFANNYFGNQDHLFKLDSSSETANADSSDFSTHAGLFDLSSSPSPKKRKRDDSFFVVGKRIRMETPPDHLDLSTLYAEDQEDFPDPLHFEMQSSNPNEFLIDETRNNDDSYSNTSGSFNQNDRSNTSNTSANAAEQTWCISPNAKELNLWSPKSLSGLNTSPKHFLKLPSL